MAKALNCEKGPTAEPCLDCSPCRRSRAGSDVDVQEIDGASYNGVDEVRRLQESLPYRPARDRYKIFIVDEVHMLSQSAWNAFLKTLEEPPPHVKFIFATTEVHKVPVTILSRCQRYDFKLIPTQLIAKRLRYVLEQEKHRGRRRRRRARRARGRGQHARRDEPARPGDRVGRRQARRRGGVARARRGGAQRAPRRSPRAHRRRRRGVPARRSAELADQGYDMAHVAARLLAAAARPGRGQGVQGARRAARSGRRGGART